MSLPAVDGLIVGSGEAGEGGAFGGVGMFVLMDDDGLLVLGFEVGELAVLVGWRQRDNNECNFTLTSQSIETETYTCYTITYNNH